MMNAQRLTGPLPVETKTKRRGGPAAWTLRALLALGRALVTWQQRAIERESLRGLSDHHLRDMGLTRAQVEYELSKPLWRF